MQHKQAMNERTKGTPMKFWWWLLLLTGFLSLSAGCAFFDGTRTPVARDDWPPQLLSLDEKIKADEEAVAAERR